MHVGCDLWFSGKNLSCIAPCHWLFHFMLPSCCSWPCCWEVSTLTRASHTLALWIRCPSFSWTCFFLSCGTSLLLLSGFPILLRIGPGPHTCLASSVLPSGIPFSVFGNYHVSLSCTHLTFSELWPRCLSSTPELSVTDLTGLVENLFSMALAWCCSL